VVAASKRKWALKDTGYLERYIRLGRKPLVDYKGKTPEGIGVKK
jgi:hypothetical protein